MHIHSSIKIPVVGITLTSISRLFGYDVVVVSILSYVVLGKVIGISVRSFVVLYLPHIVSVIPLQCAIMYFSGSHCVHGLHYGVVVRSPVMNMCGSHGMQSLQYVSVVAVHVADALL